MPASRSAVTARGALSKTGATGEFIGLPKRLDDVH
jgi:hypothetical protein